MTRRPRRKPRAPIERALDVARARRRLESALRSLRLKWTVTATEGNLSTAECVLHDAADRVLDFGFGKGDRETAEAGALFEATEHWFSRFENTTKENVRHGDSGTFITTTTLPDQLPISIIGESAMATMAFREYRRVGGAEAVLYPVALSSPTYVDDLYEDRERYPPDSYDYSLLERYCSNSGVAIGSDPLEATIHGILETVERHSLSSFLVEAFLHRRSKALRVIRHRSLPTTLQILLKCIERHSEHKVLLLELENEFGIPVFCAALNRSGLAIEIVGFGASLVREHAAMRSLHELQQCFCLTTALYPEKLRIKTESILARFAEHAFHRRCAELKIAEWCDDIGSISVDFQGTANVPTALNLQSYLKSLVSCVEKTGRRVYSAILATLPRGQTVTHSFIEGQDHFFCVTEGCLVLPNSLDPART